MSELHPEFHRMMRCDPRILAALVAAATWSACSSGPRYSVRQGPVEINGRKVVSLDETELPGWKLWGTT